jgi:hypothetical protein
MKKNKFRARFGGLGKSKAKGLLIDGNFGSKKDGGGSAPPRLYGGQ